MARLLTGLSSAMALLVLVGAPTSAGAQAADSAQAIFAQANEAYAQRRYEQAAALYGRILQEHQVDSPRLYGNLGNAYYRMGAYGSAIFCYRRGLRLDPPDDVANRLKANLDAARSVLQQRYRSASDGSHFIYSEPGGLAYKVTHLLGPTTLTTLFLIAWFALFALLTLRRLKPQLSGVVPAAIGSGVVALLLGLLLWGQVYTDRSLRLGVVIRDSVVLRESRHPDAHGDPIPEGLEIRIVEADPEWARIELNNGREGWVKSDAVKQL